MTLAASASCGHADLPKGYVQDPASAERFSLCTEHEDWVFSSVCGLHIAHEINNPLAIIHASADELIRRAKGEGVVALDIAVRNGERIQQTARRITKIIKSMRVVRKNQARRLSGLLHQVIFMV
jgi:nitrogen-specific signal transduction histidine kinase